MYWGLRFVISFDSLRAYAGFTDEFNRRDEEVEVEVPFVGV